MDGYHTKTGNTMRNGGEKSKPNARVNNTIFSLQDEGVVGPAVQDIRTPKTGVLGGRVEPLVRKRYRGSRKTPKALSGIKIRLKYFLRF